MVEIPDDVFDEMGRQEGSDDEIGPVTVTAEPRMELLPDEWEAVADLERAARDLDQLYSPVSVRAIQRPVSQMRAALARLDVVRGKLAERPPTRLETRALMAIVEYEETFGSGPPDEDMQAIARRALGVEHG